MADGTSPTDVLRSAEPTGAPLKLKVISGPDAGLEVRLGPGTFRIGKGKDNDLVLTDRAVSRLHLVVEWLKATVRVTDPGSTNGSFHLGARFESLELGRGAVVRVGTTELAVLADEPREGGLSLQTRFGTLLGASVAMRQVFGVLEKVSGSDTTVLFDGETGTGKDLAARSVHAASPRRAGPFVVLDLAALTSSLAESELFGHVKGAFTGATVDRAGAFERASGGTLFLDEVGELPLALQPRLLRALENREVQRLGDGGFKRVDIRVVAATHRDLAREVKEGRFREDLFHRLSVVRVTLPSLRERPGDIPILVDGVLDELGRSRELLSAQTRALLMAYRWPGNIRELRNVVERVLLLGAGGLPSASAGAGAGEALELSFKDAKERLIASFEGDYLRHLLERCEGNLSKAAREAGLDRVHLKRLLKKHALHG